MWFIHKIVSYRINRRSTGNPCNGGVESNNFYYQYVLSEFIIERENRLKWWTLEFDIVRFFQRHVCRIVASYACNTHILGRRAGDVDPGLAEEGAGAQHEDDVEQRVHGVLRDVRQRLGRREVVAQPAHRVGARRPAAAHVRPHAQQVHQEVAAELHRQHLQTPAHFITHS